MQQSTKVTIPEDLSFSELRLTRKPEGDVAFDWEPIQRTCEASGIPTAMFGETSEDNVCELITRWYHEHREHGGRPDPVAKEMLAEVRFEEASGLTASLKPGLA